MNPSNIASQPAAPAPAPKLSDFRLAVPLSMCVTVRADSEEAAKKQLETYLKGSFLEVDGVSIEGSDLGGDDLSEEVRERFDARAYANQPFEIEVEDIEEVS